MVGPLKDNDGLIITKGKEMADALNIYFSSVFTLEDKNNLYENDTAKCEKYCGSVSCTKRNN